MTKSLMQLAARDCRWPVAGEGADTRYCGNPRLGKSSYCLTHFKMSIARRDELDALRGRGTPLPARKAA
jgi:hypothetical protein